MTARLAEAGASAVPAPWRPTVLRLRRAAVCGGGGHLVRAREGQAADRDPACDGSLQCGEVVSLAAGKLTLKTLQGQSVVDLTQADGLRAVDSCTPAPK